MFDDLADSGKTRDDGPRRQAVTGTSAPDWMFSAVIHLLLVALLFTSKAGPGGGDGGGGGHRGGNGIDEFPGEGWIEAQFGIESAWDHGASVQVQPATNVPENVSPQDPPVPIPEADPVIPDRVDPSNAILAVEYVQPAAVGTPPTTVIRAATVDVHTAPSGGGSHPQHTDQAPGRAGLDRGRGDGTPGDGGDGQGGTSLFGIWDSGERIVYVIDRSSSMGHYEKLLAARRELETSLTRLDESFEFQVLYYNQQVQPLTLRRSRGLIRASAVNKSRLRSQIRLIMAEGGTRHRAALQAALDLRPTVIYFLTDAESDGLTSAELASLASRIWGTTRIHCIQFGDMPGEAPTEGNWLQQLAASTGGDYVHFRTAALRSAERIPPSLP